MKIALMLRAIEEIDGPGIATTNLIDKLIEIDRKNNYVVFYKNRDFLSRYSQYPNVKEVLIDVKSKLIYDQFFVPILSHREKVDLIFNTKFTVPLFTPIKSITIMRGSEYWIYPEYYDRLDLFYVNTMFPFYCRKATKVITLSDLLKKDLYKFLKVPLNKMATVYSAPHKRFKKISNNNYLEEIREKFYLPKEKFILSVTKPYSAIGSKRKKIYPRKNIEGIIKSFSRCKQIVNEPVKLVFLGKNIKESLVENYGNDLVANEDFVFPGYVDQEYMPAIYNMASLLIFPSYYESFGLPLVEAMACGCPIVTSNTGACPEIVGDAAITCPPDDIEKLADAMARLVVNDDLAKEFRDKCFERARSFSWDKSAKDLLRLFKDCVHS